MTPEQIEQLNHKCQAVFRVIALESPETKRQFDALVEWLDQNIEVEE